MKLVYVSNARVPSHRAHSYQTVKMCEAFAKNSLDVELILRSGTRAQKKSMQMREVWEYYGINQPFRITELPSLNLRWLDLYATRHKSKRLGIFYYLLQAISFAILATFYCLFKRADVYYTRLHFFAYFFGSLRFWHRRKIYYEAHNYTSLASKLMEKRRIDGLIVITNKLKELYIKERIPAEKILVAADGVDLSMFNVKLSKNEARRKVGLPLESKVIGYVGQLHTMGMEKGINELIEAFKILREQMDDLSLCFVGGPEERIRQYSKSVKREVLEGSIIFAGQKPPYKVPLYMKAFNVCVMPFPRTEHYAYYMSPLKLFEYMASRRPIIASDLPSIREVLNEESAILVKPGNAEALAKGIKKVLENEELARKLAENARNDVQQYTWEKRAEKILEFIANNRE